MTLLDFFFFSVCSAWKHSVCLTKQDLRRASHTSSPSQLVPKVVVYYQFRAVPAHFFQWVPWISCNIRLVIFNTFLVHSINQQQYTSFPSYLLHATLFKASVFVHGNHDDSSFLTVWRLKGSQLKPPPPSLFYLPTRSIPTMFIDHYSYLLKNMVQLSKNLLSHSMDREKYFTGLLWQRTPDHYIFKL